MARASWLGRANVLCLMGAWCLQRLGLGDLEGKWLDKQDQIELV